MDEYEFTFQGQLTVTPDFEGEEFDREAELDNVFDLTAEELARLEDVIDPIVSGALAAGTIEISLTVQASTYPEAAACADSAVRSSLHTAGVNTKDWNVHGSHYSVEFVSVTTIDPDLADSDGLVEA
jgi:hypothetical protein